jgi:ribosome maturation factor RimP
LQQQKNQQKGTTIVPFSFFNMATDPNTSKLEQMLESILADEPAYFLVSLTIKPGNNIKVFVDGDEGVKIERCVSYNRRLYKLIEEAAIYPEGDFSLEVSSPGIEEPLKLHRQYVKNIGRSIEVKLIDGTQKEGELETVAAADIIIKTITGKGKKAITEQLVIPFENIQSTIVQIKF